MKRLIPAFAVVILLGQSSEAQSPTGKKDATPLPARTGIAPKTAAPLNLPGRSLAPIMIAPTPGQPASLPAAAVRTSGPPASVPAAAGPRVYCQVPIKQIGALRLDDAVVLIRDNRVEVVHSSTAGGHYPLLIGRVIRYDSAANEIAGAKSLSGLVLFDGGLRLNDLAPSSHNDLVFRSSGSLSGQAFGCDDENLLLRTRDGQLMKVALSSVNYLRSPRAFVFSISGQRPHKVAGWQAQSVTFQDTAGKSRLGEQLVAGQRKDEFDLEEDEPMPTPMRNYSRWGPMGEDGMMFPAQMIRPDLR